MGGVDGDWSREVIFLSITAQFKQTSVGAVTVRGRNALPVCATLPSVIYGLSVTVWLMMPSSPPTHEGRHSLCPWRKSIQVAHCQITSRSHWVGTMKELTIQNYHDKLTNNRRFCKKALLHSSHFWCILISLKELRNHLNRVHSYLTQQYEMIWVLEKICTTKFINSWFTEHEFY